MEPAINAAILNYCEDHCYTKTAQVFQAEADFINDASILKSSLSDQKVNLIAKLTTMSHLTERRDRVILRQMESLCMATYPRRADPAARNCAFNYDKKVFSDEVLDSQLFDVSSLLPVWIKASVDADGACCLGCYRADGDSVWVQPKTGRISCLKISPDGCAFAVGYESGVVEYYPRLIDECPAPEFSLQIGSSTNKCLDMRMTDVRMICRMASNEFVVVSLLNGSTLRRIHIPVILCAWDIDADTGLIVGGCGDGRVLCWSWLDGVGGASVIEDDRTHRKKVEVVKCLGKRRIATCARETELVIWQIEEQGLKVSKRLTFHKNWIKSVACASPFVITASDDGVVGFWHEDELTLCGHTKVQPASSLWSMYQGSSIFTICQSHLTLWSLRSQGAKVGMSSVIGSTLEEPKPLTSLQDVIRQVSKSPRLSVSSARLSEGSQRLIERLGIENVATDEKEQLSVTNKAANVTRAQQVEGDAETGPTVLLGSDITSDELVPPLVGVPVADADSVELDSCDLGGEIPMPDILEEEVKENRIMSAERVRSQSIEKMSSVSPHDDSLSDHELIGVREKSEPEHGVSRVTVPAIPIPALYETEMVDHGHKSCVSSTKSLQSSHASSRERLSADFDDQDATDQHTTRATFGNTERASDRHQSSRVPSSRINITQRLEKEVQAAQALMKQNKAATTPKPSAQRPGPKLPQRGVAKTASTPVSPVRRRRQSVADMTNDEGIRKELAAKGLLRPSPVGGALSNGQSALTNRSTTAELLTARTGGLATHRKPATERRPVADLLAVDPAISRLMNTSRRTGS